MKKTLFIALSMILSLTMSAQTTKTIKGAVIDKNGNPLPGAQIEATGGAETTTVDADGTFSMEVPIWLKSVTASYPGMKNKKLKVSNDDMIFTMSNKDARQWFIEGIGGISIKEGMSNATTFGLMGGFLGKWGGYARFSIALGSDLKEDVTIPTVTIGAIKSLGKNFYGFFGGGFARIARWRDYSYWSYNYDYSTNTSTQYTIDNSYTKQDPAGAFDLGLIYKPINHLVVSVGYTIKTDFDDHMNHDVNVGVGYAF